MSKDSYVWSGYGKRILIEGEWPDEFVAHELNSHYEIPKCPYCSKCMCHHQESCMGKR
jgi:hypothetical protein